jgi:hypothetical protein
MVFTHINSKVKEPLQKSVKQSSFSNFISMGNNFFNELLVFLTTPGNRLKSMHDNVYDVECNIHVVAYYICLVMKV